MTYYGRELSGNTLLTRKEENYFKCIKNRKNKCNENGQMCEQCKNRQKTESHTKNIYIMPGMKNKSSLYRGNKIITSSKSWKTFSVFKLFVLGHVILSLCQHTVCASSSKWWNILNEVSEELVEDESVNSQYIDSYKLPKGLTEDFVSGDVSNTNSMYGSLADLSFRGENGEKITDEEIFKILGAQNQQGGAKLSGYFGRKGKGNVHTITSRRKLHNAKDDYRRNNRDVSDNIVESSILKPHGKIKPSSYIIEKRIRHLNKKQRRVLRNNPGIIEQISRGIRDALKECNHQFRKRQWRCPADSGKGKVMDRGYKETAYMYAITSASVAHAVAKGCAKGKIEACGCDSKIRGMGGPDWQWGGCSDNIHFGVQFSRDFVDAAESGFDLRHRVNMHNNEAGRQIVKDKTKKFCKCHGTSGSCTIKTCWLRVDNFRRVAKKLKDKYDNSKKVTQSNDGTLFKRHTNQWRMADTNDKQPRKEDLVYYESSDFCNLNSNSKVETTGRTCNSTITGPTSCAEMCCGRGYRIKEKTVKKQCECDFKWCCKVRCKVCYEKKRVNVCN